MTNETSGVCKKLPIARCIAGAALAGLVPLYAFGPKSMLHPIHTLLGENLSAVLMFLARVWFVSTVCGLFLGIIVAFLILRIPWLARPAIRFLRFARWAPFLITAWLAFLLLWITGWYWVEVYGSLTVALTASYEVLFATSVLNLALNSAAKRAAAASIMQGLLIALFLDLLIATPSWIGANIGDVEIGHKVFIVLAAAVLSINWITGRTFESAAKDKGTELLKELLRDSSRSPLYATVVIITIVALWEGFNRVVFLKASYNEWSYYTDFPSDIKASLGEMSLGLLAAAAVATLLLSVIKVFPRRLRLVPDVVFQAMQVAPLAFVSYTPLNVIRAQLLMGTDDIFKGFAWVTWTAADVAVFSFYPFALTFHGLGGEPMARRIALSLDAALPYAGAAVIYGETMFAVGGLGFSMIVAAVSFKLFSALAAFATLLFLIAILSTCLRWIAKRGLAPTPQQEMIAPSSAAA